MKSFGAGVLAIHFLLELGALAAFGYWGYHVPAGTAAKTALAIAAPLIVAVLWGTFLAPRASVPVLSGAARSAWKTAVFVAAAAALYAAGKTSLGISFLVVSLLNMAAVFLLKLYKMNP